MCRMNKTALVVLAAGLGSRFGKGIKQIAPVGPNGEIIIDYSVYDAVQAGFDKVIFIIRKNIEKEFHEAIGSRLEKSVEVAYAFQELDDLPAGFSAGARTKPWGTGQAVLACRDILDTPFAVINADDYYGKEGLRLVHDFLASGRAGWKDGRLQMCMAGYRLANTLSDNGAVTRGVCHSENGYLTEITETSGIRNIDGRPAVQSGESVSYFPDDTLCSMNLWGYPLEFLAALQEDFPVFLSGLPEGDLSTEYLLPTIVGSLIQQKKADVAVLPTGDHWFGITYQEDKASTCAAFRRLVEEGCYPADLTK